MEWEYNRKKLNVAIILFVGVGLVVLMVWFIGHSTEKTEIQPAVVKQATVQELVREFGQYFDGDQVKVLGLPIMTKVKPELAFPSLRNNHEFTVYELKDPHLQDRIPLASKKALQGNKAILLKCTLHKNLEGKYLEEVAP